MLYGTLSSVVYKYGTLLGLLGSVPTNVYKGFDNVIESVDIIIVQDETAAIIFQDGGFFVGYRVGVGFLVHSGWVAC